ncbi:homoserine dehydrogenase [Evansella tamaricis]|uniref:Homoserine dehydrogenase n=1 Tax=Evansella tamaricis TaxID=2069301 RepID=A0ABS6JB78_9BACI|nr:homoserine dehydrogenase [Evansella tamaricis]MBU9710937.1 homoserine dehydrogenase [Evansella tamaricis]
MSQHIRVTDEKKSFNIAILGFGTVGEGVYWALQKKSDKISSILGREINIPLVLVANRTKKRNIKKQTNVTDQLADVLKERQLDAVIEATPDAETAYPYVKQLLEHGISIISANKELIAKHGEELHVLAGDNHCHLLFEATVAGGIPVLNTIRHTLKANSIERFEGILNGTSNFILSKMREEGTSFSDALGEAQEKGYAELVPDKDIDGWDAYYKTMIVSRWIYGRAPIWKNSPRGIRNVSLSDIKIGEHFNGRIKHVASLVKKDGEVHAAVQPCFVLNDHPLYGVEGVNNGIRIDGSIVGSIMLQGPGAGKYPTASAMVEDMINLFMSRHENLSIEGIEFSTEGFLDQEKQKSIDQITSGDGAYWFVTGEEGIVRSISALGVEIIQAAETACIVYGRENQLSQWKERSCAKVRVYPVLSDFRKLISNRSFFEREKTVSI